MKIEDFDLALAQMFEIIQSYPNDESEVLIVCMRKFVDEKWDVICSKLINSQELLAKINSLEFDESLLSLSNLRDLYLVFLQRQDTFPQISIENTPAKKDIQKFKDEFTDRKVKKCKQFLRRIGIKNLSQGSLAKQNSNKQPSYIPIFIVNKH